MSFSLGGLTAGITKGVQYDLSFMRSFVWALKTKNTEALAALEEIAAANAKEIAGEAMTVSQARVGELLFNGDPFQGSRQLMQAFLHKYGQH